MSRGLPGIDPWGVKHGASVFRVLKQRAFESLVSLTWRLFYFGLGTMAQASTASEV